MSGDIVLANCKDNWLSKCIEWFTKSVFSHSFVMMPDILGIPMCMEAVEGGINMGQYDKLYLNNEGEGLEVWSINIDQEIKEEALRNIMNYLQVGYGFLEYPWFMWRHLMRSFGKDIKSQDNWNKDGMICSELVVEYLKACGLEDIFKNYGDGSIAPQDLQDIFKANPDLFTLVHRIRL